MSQTPRRSNTALVWLIVAVPVLVLIAIAGVGVAGQPQCAACHSGDAFLAATDAGAHGSLACGECHGSTRPLERAATGYRTLAHALSASLGGARGEFASVPDTRCLACHAAVDEGVVTAQGLRVDHIVCAEGSRCTDCHSPTAHGEATRWVRVYDMDTCLECHLTQASAECDTCHAGRPPAERVTSGVFAITHGPQWEQTHGMGNSATCSACHTAAACERCHGPGLPHDRDFMRVHAALSQTPEARCMDCHETRFCNECHGLDMPHPPAFVQGHAAESEENEALCRRCHVESDCVTCHVTHVHPGGAIGTLPPDGGLNQ